MRQKICFFFLLVTFLGETTVLSQVAVKKMGETWTFHLEEKPYPIKGVTFGYNDDPENYDRYFQELNYLGVNTIRTWGTDKNTSRMLDAAERHNIKVLVGIWLRHGRPGMEGDDSFDYLRDEEGKTAMLKNAEEVVLLYQNHPAVLAWGVGNEVYLNTETDEEKIAYSKFLEKVCQQIKSMDKSHPIGSVEAWTFGIKWWEKYVPSLDFYGINVYGKGADVLPEILKAAGATKPYAITEFGVRGEWDQPKDQNEVTIEPDDSAKYQTIVIGYNEWVVPEPTCLGLFVFQYANDSNFVSPWLLTRHRGKKRPQFWAIREAYTGEKPENEVPVISRFALPEKKFSPGEWVAVDLEASDPEGNNLFVTYFYNQRRGSRKRKDQVNKLNFRGTLSDGFEIQIPEEKEGVKIYVNVSDAFGNVGIATSSIFIESDRPIDERTLVPKAQLPFYVYRDGANQPYIPSGYMGDYQHMTVDLQHPESYQGDACAKISFASNKGWYGLAWVDPPGDWGEVAGGYNLTGATEFSFHAKASIDDHKVRIGFGLIGNGKAFPDSAKKEKEITLSRIWKKYTIKIKKEDLRYIRSGLVIFSDAAIVSHTIYLDEVVFR